MNAAAATSAMTQWIDRARTAYRAKEYGKAAQCAWHAAGTAFEVGQPISANPFHVFDCDVTAFTPPHAARATSLFTEWNWFYSLKAKAEVERALMRNRAAALPPAQAPVQVARPTVVTTASAAYAEQSGAMLVEERM